MRRLLLRLYVRLTARQHLHHWVPFLGENLQPGHEECVSCGKVRPLP